MLCFTPMHDPKKEQAEANERSEAAKMLGSRGGKATLERRGKDYMKGLAESGGKALLKKRGSKYYKEISKKAAEARKRNAAARKALLEQDKG